jgi:hypothetical protein
MLRVVACLWALGALCCAGSQTRKQTRGPDIEVAQLHAQRTGGDVAIDGKIKNAGERTHNGIVLLFDFLATGNQVITTKKSVLEVAQFAPGAETEFNVRVVDPVRAVWIRVRATDRQDRELRVAKDGPFTIE